MRPFANVQLIGAILQWAGAILLLAVFLLLRRDGTARRPVGVWVAAWTANALAGGLFAVESLALLLGTLPPAWLTVVLSYAYWPGAFAFPALVLAGSVALIDERPSRRALVAVIAIASAAGLGAMQFGVEGAASRLRDILTPVLLFGAAILVLVRATGRRQRGLVFLGSALTLHATVSTLYLLARLGNLGGGPLESTVSALAVSSGYGDVVTLVILGSAVLVLLVQDSFGEVDRAREERLQGVAQSEARLRQIIAAAGEAIITLDEAGRVELVNVAAERLFAASAMDLIGRPLDDLLQSRGSGRRLDGTTFPAAVTVGPLHDASENGSVVIVRDLTQQAALEQDREQLDRRLAESEKMLAIGRIVSGVAHELNNPLAVVLGQSEQLVAETADGELRSGLRLINEQAHRARHIVKDLLAFVRPRDDRRSTFALQPVIGRAIASVAPRGDSAPAIMLTESPQPLEADADEMALEQVIVNLLDNAIAAAGASGRVALSYRGDGRWIEVVVEDSGAGVADSDVPRLFEPFFTTKPTGEGTGLGLPVSLGLIQQQGGTIRFENRPAPGIGARFTVTVPQGVPATGLHAQRPTPKSALFPSPGWPGAEVLLVDDEASVRATLARMFRRSGWVVRECGSGDEALALLLATEAAAMPAVILCDLKMPGMGGQQLHEQLVVHRPEALHRLAFVTGDVVAPATAAFLASCGCPVVEKPFTIAEVATVVEQLLPQRT